MTVFAHSGHWLASIMYAMPVIVLTGFLGVARFKDRRQQKAKGDAPPAPDVTV